MKKLTITRKNNATLSKRNSKRNRQHINNIKRNIRTQHAGASKTTTSVPGRKLHTRPNKTSIASAAHMSVLPDNENNQTKGEAFLNVFNKHMTMAKPKSMPHNNSYKSRNNKRNNLKTDNKASAVKHMDNVSQAEYVEDNGNDSSMIEAKRQSLAEFKLHSIKLKEQKRIDNTQFNNDLDRGIQQSLELQELQELQTAKTQCFQTFINIIDNNNKHITLKDIKSILENIKKLLQKVINKAVYSKNVYDVIKYLNSMEIEYDKKNMVNVLVYNYIDFLNIYNSGELSGNTEKVFYEFYVRLLTFMIIREYTGKRQ
jgi:hypothetical protein